MITDKHKELAHWAMEQAIKNGCQASRVSLHNGSHSDIEIRDHQIDRLQQASENALGLHIFVDGRFGAFSTNRLDKKELEKFIKDNIEGTRFLAEDKARSLPDASLYYQGNGADLQLMDPNFDQVNPDTKVELAMKTCEEMLGKDDRVISASASYSDEQSYKYIVASNGFEGESCSSSFSLFGSVSIKGDGDARPEAYWYDSALYFNDLTKQGIGAKALERALRKLGQQKTRSGKYQMVVDNLNAAQLLGPVVEALYGSSIQQKNSFLLDKLDQQVLGKNVTLRDEPHQPKTVGARYFDNEGVATHPMAVFESGVLKSYFIDTYAANKMQVKQTISSPSILTLATGDKDTDGLIAQVNKGILVTGFNGGNCNSTTGDFSYGVEGFLIENGQLKQPISEMNVTGNMIKLWNQLVEAGNDPRKNSSWRIPGLLFDGIDFSGL